jgi:hypothetical protein
MQNANSSIRVNQRYVGQDFDEFLDEDGISSEVKALAIKKVDAARLQNGGNWVSRENTHG